MGRARLCETLAERKELLREALVKRAATHESECGCQLCRVAGGDKQAFKEAMAVADVVVPKWKTRW